MIERRDCRIQPKKQSWEVRYYASFEGFVVIDGEGRILRHPEDELKAPSYQRILVWDTVEGATEALMVVKAGTPLSEELLPKEDIVNNSPIKKHRPLPAVDGKV